VAALAAREFINKHMFATSRDILNLILSVCALALTLFICWALYYFISGIHKLHNLIQRAETGVAKIEEVIAMAREKLKNSATYFMILGEIAKRAMEFVQEKRAERQTEKQNKKTSNK